MKGLVIMKNKQAVTTSLQVSESFKKEHKHVLRDIRELEKDTSNFGLMFFESVEPDSYGRNRKVYFMNRKGFILLVMGYTGKTAFKFKESYIDAFDAMEDHIKSNQLAIPQSPMEALQLMFDAHKETNSKVKEVDERVTDLEENAHLSPGEYSYLNKRVSQRVYEVARAYGNITNKQRGEFFKDINQGIKQITGIATRTQLRQRQFEDVLHYINDWEPSTATKTIVRQMAFELGVE